MITPIQHLSTTPSLDLSVSQPYYTSSVMPVNEWRRQDRMAGATHLLEALGESSSTTNMDKILVKWATCQLCGIGVGPDHHEQKLYLYPIRDTYTYIEDDRYVYFREDCLLICGGCAQNKRRALDPSLVVLSKEHWLTTYFLDGDTTTPSQREDTLQASTLRQAWHEALAGCQLALFLLYLSDHAISAHLLLSLFAMQYRMISHDRILAKVNQVRIARKARTGQQPHLTLVYRAPDDDEPPTPTSPAKQMRLSRYSFSQSYYAS